MKTFYKKAEELKEDIENLTKAVRDLKIYSEHDFLTGKDFLEIQYNIVYTLSELLTKNCERLTDLAINTAHDIIRKGKTEK